MACWITFFADGARRNSSRWDLYSRLGDTGFLRADGMIAFPGELVRQFSVLDKSEAHVFSGCVSASRPSVPAGRLTRVGQRDRGVLLVLGDNNFYGHGLPK